MALSWSSRYASARLACETNHSSDHFYPSPLQAVPAQSGSAGYANSQGRRNLRAIGYHTRRKRMCHLIACTYNCRSVSSAAQISALIDETRRITYHVIGLYETKRKELLSCTWTDGTAVHLRARKVGTTSGGVGFIVAPQFAKNITGVTFHSHQLAMLTASLSKDMDVSIVQVYAPTADKVEEHDGFYNELEDLVHSLKTSYVVVMGDFNARVGPRRAKEASIGQNSSEERSEAGERLVNFCETHHFFHGNSQFVKAPLKMWTYVSPNGQHYHELDHILCNRRAITDVGVVIHSTQGATTVY